MTDRPFIGSLTGLRLVAAASVAVGHGALSLRRDWLSQPPAQISRIRMTLFFVLRVFVPWPNYANTRADVAAPPSSANSLR